MIKRTRVKPEFIKFHPRQSACIRVPFHRLIWRLAGFIVGLFGQGACALGLHSLSQQGICRLQA